MVRRAAVSVSIRCWHCCSLSAGRRPLAGRSGCKACRLSNWRLVYSRQAQKDAKKLASSGLKSKAQRLLDVIADDPFANPPRYEKLVGDLAGCYSRRINIQHGLVYEVLPDDGVVHVLRMWTHYE